MRTIVEAPVTVDCSKCGVGFQVVARTARRWQSKGSRPLCPSCQPAWRRRPDQASAGGELPDAERERFRAWWLERYTREELLEIAGTLLPDVT